MSACVCPKCKTPLDRTLSCPKCAGQASEQVQTMTSLDALEVVDKSASKLELINVLLNDSLEQEGTHVNLKHPSMKSGLYHFLGDIADDLHKASKALQGTNSTSRLVGDWVRMPKGQFVMPGGGAA